jgi:PDZ domain-containing protein
VQALRPGAPVTLLVSRPAADDDRTLHLTVPTIRLSGKAAIGIRLQPSLRADLPLKVTIDSGDIQGPSAGLMFALSIVNRLSPVDLTHGHKIAGTGTIDLFGNVGPIGGVKQKVIGARQAGAQYFFVPVDNYAEARPYAQGITLIRVNTLQQALNVLHGLR